MCSEFERAVTETALKHNMITKGDSITVGVSGGADSVSLLVYLCSIRQAYNLTLTAVHVNHGIRGKEAERDENFVIGLCKILDVDCRVYKADIPSIAERQKISEELAGRNERYRIFSEVCSQVNASKIAVAHNKNDSAETVLIKMTRGCSLNGLRGISPTNGKIIRPLIEMPRSSIERYLEEKGFAFVTDSTNNENVYTRNIIRNSVIPELEKINPGFIGTVCANSRAIACDDDFIEEYASRLYNKCITTENEKMTVDFSSEDMHPAVKKRIILHAFFLLKGNKADIEQKHLDILISAYGTGKQYDVGSGVTARLEYGKLVFTRNTDRIAENYEIAVDDIDNKTYTAGNMRIKFEICDNTVRRSKECTYIDYDKLKDCSLSLRNRRDGDRFIPSGMTGYKKLKKFFIDLKLTKQVRDTVPLLCADGEIAAVIGYRVDNRYLTSDKTKKILKISFCGGTYE